MSTVRVIYSEEPKFPATDQHPDAMRYKVGDKWVDAIGGEPTQEEVDEVLNPPPGPAPEDRLAKLEAALTTKGILTSKDIDQAVVAEASAKP